MDYTALASKEIVDRTVLALTANHVEAVVVKNGAEALEKIKSFIPQGASVIMNGSSVTLEQVGFVDYLKSGTHGWNNLHEGIVAEKDPVKQSALHKQAVLSDYYLGSVQALAETGEFIIASNTGSQLSHIVFTSKNLIFVVSTKKIVPTFAEAMKRLEDYIIPLEEKHMMEKYGAGTAANKIVVFKGENPKLGRKVRMILVEEDLGF
jgi:L-lactate utilization protein LutC